MMARNCPRCFARIEGAVESCPHCGHAVRAPQAAPEPGAATSDRPVLSRPPDAVPGTRTAEVAAPEAPPWERRRTLGFWRALWLTWRDSVFLPVPFFRRLPPRSGQGSALGYSIVLTVIGFLFSSYWSLVEGFLSGGEPQEGGLTLILVGGFVGFLLVLIVLIPLYVGLLYALVALIHLGFLVVGAARQGFEATFRAVAYSSGTAAFAIFPFFGPVISSVWWMVLIFIAVREIQRTTSGRATLAFLVPVVLLAAVVVLLALLLQAVLANLELPVAV